MSIEVKVRFKDGKDRQIYTAKRTYNTTRIKTNTGEKVIFPGDWLIESRDGSSTFCRDYIFDNMFEIV